MVMRRVLQERLGIDGARQMHVQVRPFGHALQKGV